jgi:hypothetical protein
MDHIQTHLSWTDMMMMKVMMGSKARSANPNQPGRDIHLSFYLSKFSYYYLQPLFLGVIRFSGSIPLVSSQRLFLHGII